MKALQVSFGKHNQGKGTEKNTGKYEKVVKMHVISLHCMYYLLYTWLPVGKDGTCKVIQKICIRPYTVDISNQ